MFRSLIPFGHRADTTRSDDPFASLQREMNRLFDDGVRGYLAPAGHGRMAFAPSMDVKETDGKIEVAAELPGVDDKDIQVTFEDGILTVKGEKKAETEETKAGYHVSERSFGSYVRSVALPGGIDGEHITATFAKGVLTVTLPKLPEEQTKARKIDVKTAA